MCVCCAVRNREAGKRDSDVAVVMMKGETISGKTLGQIAIHIADTLNPQHTTTG